jgi:hypothetical protein
MDYTAANTGLWSFFVQMGIIAGALLLSNVLVRKNRFVRNSLIPTSVLAGFLLLLLKSVGVLKIPTDFLEMVTYHASPSAPTPCPAPPPAARDGGDKGSGFRSGS